jgi:hypothetical protein
MIPRRFSTDLRNMTESTTTVLGYNEARFEYVMPFVQDDYDGFNTTWGTFPNNWYVIQLGRDTER